MKNGIWLERVRSMTRRHETLWLALNPIRKLRHRIVNRLEAPRLEMVDRIGCQLVEPCVRLPAFSGDFFIDTRSDLFRRILMYGEYEETISGNARRFLDESRDCIDVGANVGFYSVMLAKVCSGARVLAIEPMPDVLENLERNLEMNGVQDRVLVHAGAVGEAKGLSSINYVTGKAEYSTLASLVHPSVSNDAMSLLTEIVRVDPLDDLVEVHGLNPGFLKIDVEGFEKSVLLGAAGILRRFNPILLIEADDPMLKSAGSSVADIHRLVSAYGYSVLDAETLESWPLGTRSATMMLCLPQVN